MTTTSMGSAPQKISLSRVLGPIHVWALGVGIVLVGEFDAFNFVASATLRYLVPSLVKAPSALPETIVGDE